jgi:DNA methyltransferase 1-associated protein 1
MASGKDVRDILAIPQGQPSSSTSNGNRSGGITNRNNVGSSHPNKKKKPKVDGISRELYALLGDNTPSLTFAQGAGLGSGSGGESQESGRFMPKFKKRPQKTQKWTFAPFRNPARQDSLTLRHWLPEIEQEQIDQQYAQKKEQGKAGDFELASGEADDIPRIYRFSDQNTDSGVYRYSNDEYHQHLRDEDWTKEETDYLMDLCSSYDLRFVVITDRYEWTGKERSMEDLKARYYAICRRLIRSRISTDDMDARQQLVTTYSFDRTREVERKKHVARLFSRTPQQLAEEEALYVEARRLEQNEAKFAAEREELLRLLGGWERLPNVRSETVAAAGSGVGGATPEEEASAEAARKANRKRKAAGEVDEDGASTKAGDNASTPSGPLTAKQKAELRSKHFDEVQNIVRFDPQAAATLANSKPPYPHLTGTPSTYPPVAQVTNNSAASHGAYLRSTRMLMPRSNLAIKTQEALSELRPPISLRLTFPTQSNCEKWEGVVGAVTSGLEMKRQLDRVQSELRIAQMRSQGGNVPPQSQQAGSARAPSATPSTARRPSIAGRSITPQISVSTVDGTTETSAPIS